MSLINIQIDEKETRELLLEEIKNKVSEMKLDLIFMDTKELKRRTCMSWGTIQNTFFYDPRFTKYKIGGKWYFAAEETKGFLLKWLEEQKNIYEIPNKLGADREGIL
jgi:hypothetical protein